MPQAHDHTAPDRESVTVPVSTPVPMPAPATASAAVPPPVRPLWGIQLMVGWVPMGRAGPTARRRRSLNRLLALGSVMLLTLGLMMALEAPRTLGRMVGLLVTLEACVLFAAGLAWCVEWVRTLPQRLGRIGPVRHIGRAVHTRRRTPTRARTRTGAVMPVAAVDWRFFEVVVLLLMALWWWRSG